jgi:alkylation response protein AidB-like acyl-CoA dehydrogenase
MDLVLTETQQAVREVARSFARDHVAPKARSMDREGKLDLSLFPKLGELGLLGVNVSPELGGAGAGVISYSLAMSEIAYACASTSVALGVTNMTAELISRFAKPEVAKKYVSKLTSGEATVGAFALSEAHCGSDAGALKTTAVKKGNSYVINGSKQWITSGAYAGVMVVWARTSATGNKGISAFVVEGKSQGLVAGKPEDKMGLRASSTVPLTFEDCVVPEENLLGQEGDGFKLAMIALDGGRAAIDASVKYAKDRRAFDKSIGEFQGIRWMLANMKTDLSAAELLTYRAAWLKEHNKPFTREASMAKVFASEMANRVCDKAVQIHGGYGYIDEFPVERFLRDARVQTIYEGTSEIQRLVIAREVDRLLK